jgi:hypothetical protein
MDGYLILDTGWPLPWFALKLVLFRGYLNLRDHLRLAEAG